MKFIYIAPLIITIILYNISIGNTFNTNFVIKENKDGLYIGSINNKQRNGYGIQFYKNGNRFSGQWLKNKYSGIGKFSKASIKGNNCIQKMKRCYFHTMGKWEKNRLLKEFQVWHSLKINCIYGNCETKGLGYYISDYSETGLGEMINFELSSIGIKEDVLHNQYIGNFKKNKISGEGIIVNYQTMKIIHGFWKYNYSTQSYELIKNLKTLALPKYILGNSKTIKKFQNPNYKIGYYEPNSSQTKNSVVMCSLKYIEVYDYMNDNFLYIIKYNPLYGFYRIENGPIIEKLRRCHPKYDKEDIHKKNRKQPSFKRCEQEKGFHTIMNYTSDGSFDMSQIPLPITLN